jgi:hypothetical protein
VHISELDQLLREFAAVAADVPVVYVRTVEKGVRCRCPAHADPVSDRAHSRFKALSLTELKRNRLCRLQKFDISVQLSDIFRASER